jgi:light-regulated signal transduction histidine kinase (bacteriophytochrome)
METNAKLLSLNTELEKSNRDLEQFAYIASHDLQEPLRKIQTFSELSSRNTHNPEILKRYLEKINSSAKRMTQLIKAVLNYSRIAIADKEFTAVDLNAIVEHIKTDLELIIDERKAIIHSTRLPVIEANELQMHQLFLNVISNSLKFCEQSPVIKITYEIMVNSEAKTKLGIESEQDYIALSFEDNGIGFELEYADKIFSIFQRLQSSKNYAGTGIGLALCKKIVENHSGIISVESMPGQGSTFHIYLPITYNVGISEELVKTEESIISTGLN